MNGYEIEQIRNGWLVRSALVAGESGRMIATYAATLEEAARIMVKHGAQEKSSRDLLCQSLKQQQQQAASQALQGRNDYAEVQI